MLKSLNPMGLLLRAHGYPPAVVVSVSLHVLVIFLMLEKNFQPDNLVSLEAPQYVSTAVTQQNPQRLRRLENNRRIAVQAEAAAAEREREQRAQQEQQEATRRREEQDRENARQEEIARLDSERQANEQLERDRETARERDRERREATERQRELAEANERARQENLAREEATRQAQAAAANAANQAASDNDSMQGYKLIIHNAIVNYWKRPPSARNGLTVVVQLRLIRTGEIIAKEIIQSSGNAAFDRSALQAVDKTGGFPELQQMPSRLFDRQFRTVTLTFRPEDLLR